MPFCSEECEECGTFREPHSRPDPLALPKLPWERAAMLHSCCKSPRCVREIRRNSASLDDATGRNTDSGQANFSAAFRTSGRRIATEDIPMMMWLAVLVGVFPAGLRLARKIHEVLAGADQTVVIV
jgi:hypothetical protein